MNRLLWAGSIAVLLVFGPGILSFLLWSVFDFGEWLFYRKAESFEVIDDPWTMYDFFNFVIRSSVYIICLAAVGLPALILGIIEFLIMSVLAGALNLIGLDCSAELKTVHEHDLFSLSCR
ncbi:MULTISPECIES: hypothetical protein [unclassified Ruegeria]|uniref:hypothetical protein n=1 Tax=unclassified Ruegeria TaxID=2625375 RepID=UPI001492BE9E|nr:MULTISPECIES: hypothetical protein [unclassified Ruegeria]NOD88373.1 hypothetical protein [Ruegeria sp. HKCCD4318]NOE13282.1 hypothetical protein [Ruegeria sp. HKCCD4318-2]NOG11176.1 hypothetical protein [Ruegeria sp. HKCCD4315]